MLPLRGGILNVCLFVCLFVQILHNLDLVSGKSSASVHTSFHQETHSVVLEAYVMIQIMLSNPPWEDGLQLAKSSDISSQYLEFFRPSFSSLFCVIVIYNVDSFSLLLMFFL